MPTCSRISSRRIRYYIGVMDILLIAIRKGVYTEADCNAFIHAALAINDARFPVRDIKEYQTDSDLEGF